MNSQQLQMLTAVLITYVGPWVARRHFMSAEQFGDFLNQTIAFVQSVVVPVLGLAWAWWQNRNHKLVAVVAANPAVAHVAMVTDAAANSAHLVDVPKVLGPSELPGRGQ